MTGVAVRFRSVAGIGSIPVFVFVTLRLIIRDGLGIRLGYRFITDYDFVPPAFIAFVILTFILFKKEKIELRFQKKTAVLCASFLSVFLGLTVAFRSLVSYDHLYFICLWFSLAALSIASSAFLFVPPRYYLKHSQRLLIIPGLVVASTNLIAIVFFDSLWEPLAHLTGLLTHGFLKVFLPRLTYHLHFVKLETKVDEYTVLSTTDFGLSIGRGCGGLEGIVFFITVMGLLYMVESTRFFKKDWIWMSVAGAMYIYVLNIFRLALFYLVSLGAIRLWGENVGIATVRLLLHGGLAWFIYSAGLLGFFILASKFLGAQPRESSKLGTDLLQTFET